MIAPPIPLVWAKLQPPLPSGQPVRRVQLIEDLAASGAVLTAIVAPPGYGKTTTAVQLGQRLDLPLAWVSLERADSSPARFWTYVAAALAAAGVDGADLTYRDLADDGVDTATLTLRSAIEAWGEVVLVLDDFHAIDSSEIEQQLTEWLRHPIANLRLICTSRSDLPLPVGRLRTQGVLGEARVEQLAFTSDESSELLRSTFGLAQLSAPQLATLETRTQGWPVGLYLAGLTLRNEPDVQGQLDRFAGDTRHLTEYLSSEAMDGVSADVRAFALATSIVSVLDPDLCDALTGQAGSLKTLRSLVRDNVFTSALDPAGMLFHYHPLFREHLRSALLAEHPELVPDLHRRASLWFEARDRLDDAIAHAIAAGDIERAEVLIVSTSFEFSNAGHFDTVRQWVDALGDPTQLRLETKLVMAWTMLNLRHYDDLSFWLEHVAQATLSESEQQLVDLQVAAIRAHQCRHQGDVGSMLGYASASLDAASRYPAPDDVDSIFTRSEAGKGAAFTVRGVALFWAGDLEQSKQDLLAGLAIARSAGLLIEVIYAYGYLAMVEADLGDSDSAIAHADQALALINPGEERHHQPTLAHLARSTALLAKGRPADSQVAVQRARELSSVRPEPLCDALIELQTARLQHRTGEVEAARASIRAAKALVVTLPDPRLDERIRAVEAETRFVSRDATHLPSGARRLTDREQAVLVMLPHGLPRKELAAQLHVSENTIKTHLTSIRHKLGITGRASIVERARELNLLD